MSLSVGAVCALTSTKESTVWADGPRRFLSCVWRGPTMASAHPIRGVVAVRRIPIRGLARCTGVSEDLVGRVLNGERRGSPLLRRRLASLVGQVAGQPAESLFDDAVSS